MAHLKRQKVPKNWPIHRKGTKFVVRPSDNLNKGIPILIVLRDMLKIAKNRKEVKKAIHGKSILLNNKIVRDETNSATLFDVVTVSNKNHRLSLSDKGKFKFDEVKEAGQKVSKIVDKKILKGKKVQLNFIDGGNLLSDVKCKTNDSVVINFKDKKIEKCLPLQEKANAVVFGGKHAGAKGKIGKIDLKHRMIELSCGETPKDVSRDISKEMPTRGKINVLIKHLVVVE